MNNNLKLVCAIDVKHFIFLREEKFAITNEIIINIVFDLLLSI